MSFLDNDKQFFRYLLSKVVQTTPSDASPEDYADHCFQRAKQLYAMLLHHEGIASTDSQPPKADPGHDFV